MTAPTVDSQHSADPTPNAASAECRWRRHGIRLFAGLIVIALTLTGCAVVDDHSKVGTQIEEQSLASSSHAMASPARVAGDGGRILQLSKTVVSPGQIISRTVVGANANTDVTSVIMMLESYQKGSWQAVSVLWLSNPPSDSTPVPNEVIPAVGVTPRARKLRIPNVPPGTYRIRQDMSITNSSIPITLYAAIVVVPATTPGGMATPSRPALVNISHLRLLM